MYYCEDITEYLVSYGAVGEFGRFRPDYPSKFRRGDKAVIHSHRGMELGVVLCEARAGHARYLPNTSVGKLLRRATAGDQQTAADMQDRCRRFFADSRRLAADLSMPFEILDVELLLDGRQAILHYLRWADCDERQFVSALSKQHGLFVALHNLSIPAHEEAPEEEHHGCGAEGCGNGACGSSGGGHCSTCAVADLFRHSKVKPGTH